MVGTIKDFKAAGIDTPVLVGGAALTQNFTSNKIQTEYDGLVVTVWFVAEVLHTFINIVVRFWRSPRVNCIALHCF